MFNSPATQTIAAAEEGLNTLTKILDLVANPRPLLDLHKVARDEAQLTGEQQSKYQEAVEFMSQYEQLAQKIENDKAALKTREDALEQDTDSFRAWKKEEGERLDTQKKAQEIVQTQQENRAKKMDDDWKEMEEKYSAAITPIDDHRAQNERDQKANEKEALRLKNLAAKLDRKAKKMATAVVDEEADEEEAA